MKNKLIYLFVFALFLVGCSISEPNSTPSQVIPTSNLATPFSSTQNPTSPSLTLPPYTQKPRLTYTLDTPTPIILETNTPRSKSELMEDKCLQIVNGFPQQYTAKGFIYTNVGPGPGNNVDTNYISEINLNANTIITSAGYNEYISSPNGLMIAIYHALTNQNHERINGELRIETSAGKRVSTYPWDEKWQGFHWLDNEKLIIYQQQDPNYYLYSLKIINPFTNQESEINPSFPDIDRVTSPYHPYYPIPDKTLTKVVYLLTNKQKRAWVLWDLIHGTELTELSSGMLISGSETPIWSPDGSKFVVNLLKSDNTAEEFFSIRNDGLHTIQLTHFNDLISDKIRVIIKSFSWSPDGRYIAFWVAVDPSTSSGERLAILDTSTLSVTNYCIPGSNQLYASGSASPIWSPNSLQFVVESYDDQGYVHTILVDIGYDIAYNLADYVRPTAWVINQH